MKAGIYINNINTGIYVKNTKARIYVNVHIIIGVFVVE